MANRESTTERERGLFKRGKYWYTQRFEGDRRVRSSTRCTRIKDAIKVAEMRSDHGNYSLASAWWRSGPDARTLDPENVVRHMLAAAKSRAVKKGLRCTFTAGSLLEMYKATNGRCAITDIPFSDVRIRSRRPFLPSLDRIDAAADYTVGNCRIVCYVVNLALSDFGPEPLLIVAHALAAQMQRQAFMESFAGFHANVGSAFGAVLGPMGPLESHKSR